MSMNLANAKVNDIILLRFGKTYQIKHIEKSPPLFIINVLDPRTNQLIRNFPYYQNGTSYIQDAKEIEIIGIYTPLDVTTLKSYPFYEPTPIQRQSEK